MPPVGNPSGISYGDDVYQQLPALRMLAGNMSQADFDQISSMPVQVPGLNVTLPAPNQLNYERLMMLQQTDPDGFALLNSLYTAANMPLTSLMGFIKSRAPLGTAYETSLVSTV